MLLNRKGQGLTEFALILPLLLLLLLGIIEASRIIWAYITVQTAAREAARYAITGKPYIDAAGLDTKTGPDPASFPNSPCRERDGEASTGASNPWLCDPYLRAYAIKAVAEERGQTLSVSTFCNTPSTFDPASVCAQQPGAFGIQVIGQVVSPTVSITQPIAVEDYAGTPGLNVRVSTFYNVQMLDPIFDAIFAGTFIQVRGDVEMQNEGVDAALGAEPPPAIDESVFSGSKPPGTGPNGERISVLNGYTKAQGEQLQVLLEEHSQKDAAGVKIYYDIYLENVGGQHKICSHIEVTFQGRAEVLCSIGFDVLPGEYELYSTREGELGRVAPNAPSPVTIKASSNAGLVLRDPNTKNILYTWAAGSPVEVMLVNHKTADENFAVRLYEPGGGYLDTVQDNVPALTGGNPTTLAWTIPSVPDCPTPTGGSPSAPCNVESRQMSALGNTYADTQIYINQPEIVLAGGNMLYAQGETMYIYLRKHTPGLAYQVRITSASGMLYYEGETEATDEVDGDTTNPLAVPIPEGATGWPDGFYTITSHPLGDPGVEIARLENVELNTPSTPYITVDGGYVWPINSFINIKVHKHEGEARHYLEFGPWRVPTTDPGPPDTFETAFNGTAVKPYQIPVTATEGTAKTFTIASYIDETAGPYTAGEQIATRDVEVFPTPLITVLEGDSALPDAKITVRLTNHSPNTSYAVYYAGEFMFNVLTDANGQAERVYDLGRLPRPPFGPSPTCTYCYGTAYEMYSQQNLSPFAKVASTQFTIRVADLELVSVEVPPAVEINTTIPVTLTIRNTQPVAISRYFDIDFYHYYYDEQGKLQPSPLLPSPQVGQVNFPGDYKVWQNSVPPGATFTKVEDFFVGKYGLHRFYGYADTSDFVFSELSELNNTGGISVTVACLPQLNTETFGSLPGGWTSTEFGNGISRNNYPQINNGQLVLQSKGSRSTLNNDNGGGQGLFYYHKSSSISTAAGLDVRVQLFEVPTTSSWAKAGLQLRNSLDGRSEKIEFDITGANRVQLTYRSQFNQNSQDVNISNAITFGPSNPVWLRIRRLPTSDTFEFYYLHKAGTPTEVEWGATSPFWSGQMSAMNDQLYLGVFNASYSNQWGKAVIDNFVLSSTDSCPEGQGQDDEMEVPPGLEICESPLVNTGFESAADFRWTTDPDTFSVAGKGGFNASNRGLLAPTYFTSHNIPGPFFYQQFPMSTWVISTSTTFKVSLSKFVDDWSSADSDDQFFVAILDGSPSSPTATLVTVPQLVANGADGSNWLRLDDVELPVSPGINLEDYATQNLFVHFYNTSNTDCNPFGGDPTGCHDTTYYFDDVDLSVCTKQPEPDPIDTQIHGELTLVFPNGDSQKIPGVKVWAYAEDGELYQTYTIQNGQFNFYNLPATASGTKYFIYAEYHLTDPNDPSQIDTLSAEASVVLKTSNDGNNPVTTVLKLQSLQ